MPTQGGCLSAHVRPEISASPWWTGPVLQGRKGSRFSKVTPGNLNLTQKSMCFTGPSGKEPKGGGLEKLDRGGPVRRKKYWLEGRFCLSHSIQANWISLLAVKPFGNDAEFTVGVRSSVAELVPEPIRKHLRYEGMLSTSDQTGYSKCYYSGARTAHSQTCLPLSMFGYVFWPLRETQSLPTWDQRSPSPQP